MPTATITSKGQITIPIEVRKSLKLKAGDKINFFETEDGKYTFEPKTGSIMDLRGCIPNLGYTVSIEEMDEAIMDHVAELDAVTLSDEGRAALAAKNGRVA